MQELEKILEEIDIKVAGSMGKKREGLLEAQDIIRKHLSGKDTDVPTNDGWIPVEEPPEDGQTVLCTDGEYVYLVEYDADLDAPFGDMDGITHWQPRPEPYRPASGTDRPDWRDGMLRKFDRRG